MRPRPAKAPRRRRRGRRGGEAAAATPRASRDDRARRTYRVPELLPALLRAAAAGRARRRPARGATGASGCRVPAGVPTQLNQMLATGAIDFGPISSIAYARNHRTLLLSRQVSITSLGAVESIQLVSRRPLEKIHTVALTGQSATAVALVKILFGIRFGQKVYYQILVGSLDEGLEKCDAVLLIGDQALAAYHYPPDGAACYDLGELWQEWTGLPMVYAVWAAREDFALAHGEELLAVEQELVECMDYGTEHLAEVVESAAERYPFDRESLTDYFALLRYDFGPEYQKGLLRFYELAYKAGELDEVPALRFIDEFAAAPGAGS